MHIRVAEQQTLKQRPADRRSFHSCNAKGSIVIDLGAFAWNSDARPLKRTIGAIVRDLLTPRK